MKELKIIPLKCPHCGRNLEGEDVNVVFFCPDCYLALEVVGEVLKKRNLETVKAVSEGEIVYLPLWCFEVNLKLKWEKKVKEEVLRALERLEKVYVRGFTLRRTMFYADIGLEYTERGFKYTPEGKAIPTTCTVSLIEAKRMAEAIVLRVIDRRVDITGLELELEYLSEKLLAVPFVRKGHRLEDLFARIQIPLATLGSVRI